MVAINEHKKFQNKRDSSQSASPEGHTLERGAQQIENYKSLSTEYGCLDANALPQFGPNILEEDFNGQTY